MRGGTLAFGRNAGKRGGGSKFAVEKPRSLSHADLHVEYHLKITAFTMQRCCASAKLIVPLVEPMPKKSDLPCQWGRVMKHERFRKKRKRKRGSLPVHSICFPGLFCARRCGANRLIILVHPTGFEPVSCANLAPMPRYKLGVLPLNYRSINSSICLYDNI